MGPSAPRTTVLLAAVTLAMVACGGSGGDAASRNPGAEAATGPDVAGTAEAPEPTARTAGDDRGRAAAEAGGDEEPTGGDPDSPAPMPPLSVDRRVEPAPASLPPVGELVELQGVVASWPQVAGAEVRAALQLQIADGFHVNANPPSEDWIIATEVRLEKSPGIELRAVHYPPPEAIEFEFWPEPLDVWEDEAVVGLELAVASDAAPGERTVRIIVLYQACNDEACFRPMEAALRLPLEIAPAGTTARAVESRLLERAPFPQG